MQANRPVDARPLWARWRLMSSDPNRSRYFPIHRHRGPVLGVLLFALTIPCLFGCEDEGDAEIEPDPGASAALDKGGALAAPAKPKSEEKAGPTVVDQTFELTASASGPFTKGQLANFGITLAGRGGWHLNQDFPTKVEISAPSSVALPKKALDKVDAAEFGEERAHFDVPFTASEAGKHEVTAKVSFAICTDDNCIPEQRTLALILPVEGG